MKQIKLSERAIESVRPYCVYRFFDGAGTLLYVGVSSCFIQRLCGHQDDKEWFPEVCRMEIEYFDTRAEALAFESAEIRDRDPLYNVQGKRADGRRPPSRGIRPKPEYEERPRPTCAVLDCGSALMMRDNLCWEHYREACAAEIRESAAKSREQDSLTLRLSGAYSLVESVSGQLSDDAKSLLIAVLAQSTPTSEWRCSRYEMAKHVGIGLQSGSIPSVARLDKAVRELMDLGLLEKRPGRKRGGPGALVPLVNKARLRPPAAAREFPITQRRFH